MDNPSDVWDGLDIDSRCLIAIPKKGRLNDKLVPLLDKIGLHYIRKNRLDIAHVTCLPGHSSVFCNVSVVFLPAQDIATFVSSGRIDLGITGLDVTQEGGELEKIEVISKLGFGKCRLSACSPHGGPVKALIGKRIATSFPNLTSQYFDCLDEKQAGTTKIFNISGSVEVSCSLGLADAVVDLVETGNTLKAVGLKEVATLLESEAILIANPSTKYKDIAKVIAKRLEGVIIAQQYVMIEYDIPRTLLDKAVAITPGKVSPTICPLENPDWVSVKVVHSKKGENDAMDQLESIGAVAIVVTNINNVRG